MQGESAALRGDTSHPLQADQRLSPVFGEQTSAFTKHCCQTRKQTGYKDVEKQLGWRETVSDTSKKQVYKLMVTTRKQTGMAYCKTWKNILLKISSAYLPSFATEKEKSNSYCEVLREKSMVQLIKIHQHHDAILLPLTTEDWEREDNTHRCRTGL